MLSKCFDKAVVVQYSKGWCKGTEIVFLAKHVDAMLKVCHDMRIDRHSYVIGIGGGALLDAVGLVAAIAHRGIRHIRIPTTVLAQNDSGVGVKNGINMFGQKNYLGSFAPPFAVLNDYRFIETLAERDRICGMSCLLYTSPSPRDRG